MITASSALRFAAQANDKPVLLSTDLDDTLVHWLPTGKPDEMKLARNKQTLRKSRSELVVHVNTGRGLTAFKELGPLLKRMPLDFLSLNNGQELYVNQNAKDAVSWVRSLAPEDQEKTWKQHIKRTRGWDAAQVMQTLQEQLQAMGLKHSAQLGNRQVYTCFVTPQRMMNVSMYSDQPAIFVQEVWLKSDGTPEKREATAQSHDLAVQLMNRVIRQLTPAMRISMDWKVSNKVGQSYGIYILEPQGIHKGNVIDYLTRRLLKQPRAVITAGDHEYNDQEMLSRLSYQAQAHRSPGNQSGRKSVPNYPIVSGNRPALVEALKAHPRVEQVELGELQPGLEAQLEKIRTRFIRMA